MHDQPEKRPSNHLHIYQAQEVLNTIESVDVYAGNKKVATIILKTDNKQQTD